MPHSDIHGSTPADGSPWLLAVSHVLLRPSVPRHPPCALPRSAPRPLASPRRQDHVRYLHSVSDRRSCLESRIAQICTSHLYCLSFPLLCTCKGPRLLACRGVTSLSVRAPHHTRAAAAAPDSGDEKAARHCIRPQRHITMDVRANHRAGRPAWRVRRVTLAALQLYEVRTRGATFSQPPRCSRTWTGEE